ADGGMVLRKMAETDRAAQGPGRCMGFARPESTVRGLHSLLLMGGASVVLLGGGYSADAADRAFVWNGNENLTSFARAGNWDQVWEAGGNPVLDGDGNPTFEQDPVLDTDGNPVFEQVPVTDEEGNPLFDDDGN